MKRTTVLTIAAAGILFCASSQVMAWIQYNDGLTHNISSTINDDVWVDFQSPGKQTTVNLLNGGIISENYRLQGFNDSRINMSGGSVTYLDAYDRSQVTMYGGAGSVWHAHNSSQVRRCDKITVAT
jgi:hypothetical protein